MFLIKKETLDKYPYSAIIEENIQKQLNRKKMYQNLKNMLNCDFITTETKAEIKEVLEKLQQKTPTRIGSLIDEFVRITESKNITLYRNNEYSDDNGILSWLLEVTVNKNPAPKGTWKPVDATNGTVEEEAMDTAVKMPLSQAIVKVTEMVKNGEFDKKRTCRIIFLTETRNGEALKLVCSWHSNGTLDLNVSEVSPGGVWEGINDAWFGS